MNRVFCKSFLIISLWCFIGNTLTAQPFLGFGNELPENKSNWHNIQLAEFHNKYPANIQLASVEQSVRALKRVPDSKNTNTKRIALVIGNSAYTRVAPLRNPVNDAGSMAKALKDVGFNVTYVKNADRAHMDSAIRKFGESLKITKAVGLFYYAGHGVQIDGKNFLIPVNAYIENEFEAKYEGTDLNRLLDAMKEAGNKANIIILDACRNNPFKSSTRGISGGLAEIVEPNGTLIAYATAPGKVAADGNGFNGTYTKHLLKYIYNPDLLVKDYFEKVSIGVKNETNGKQVPWEHSSLTGDIYINNIGKIEIPEIITTNTTLVMPQGSIDHYKPKQPWYKRWYTWTIVGTVVTALIVGCTGGGEGGTGGGGGGGGGACNF